MTNSELRDHFAGLAITGIVAAHPNKITGTVDDTATFVAKQAYAIADALLAQREADKPTMTAEDYEKLAEVNAQMARETRNRPRGF